MSPCELASDLETPDVASRIQRKQSARFDPKYFHQMTTERRAEATATNFDRPLPKLLSEPAAADCRGRSNIDRHRCASEVLRVRRRLFRERRRPHEPERGAGCREAAYRYAEC